MNFFDCNCFIGLPANGILRPITTAPALLAQMDRSGVSKAVVWHVAQRDYSEAAGNKLLTDALAGQADRLVGCWSVLPLQTHELPEPNDFFAQMARANVRVLRAFPRQHRFMLRREVVGELFDAITARRIPLMLSVAGGATWEDVYDLMAEFPELVCIICDVGCWGPDRLFRPLLERYPNVYVEISEYILDYGIDDVVHNYGSRRLLYGSGFPAADHGPMMLSLKHAEIEESQKEDIASKNIERILNEVKI